MHAAHLIPFLEMYVVVAGTVLLLIISAMEIAAAVPSEYVATLFRENILKHANCNHCYTRLRTPYCGSFILSRGPLSLKISINSR
jgi:hypothetical protein